MIEKKINNYLNEGRYYKLSEKATEGEISSSDFWYDLTDGGYLSPEELLANANDVREVKNAIKILLKFKDSLEDGIEGFVQ